MIDPADRVRDQRLSEGQYRHITELAWSSCDVSTRLRDWKVLRESVREQWVPADVTSEWVLRGRYTGRRRWLRGSQRSAIARGFGGSLVDDPDWEYRAAYGDYSAAEQDREAAPRDGCWQLPSPEFLAELPRDPDPC